MDALKVFAERRACFLIMSLLNFLAELLRSSMRIRLSSFRDLDATRGAYYVEDQVIDFDGLSLDLAPSALGAVFDFNHFALLRLMWWLVAKGI